MIETTCSVEECGRSVLCRQVCERHYRRLRLFGDPLGTGRKPRGVCSADGCEQEHVARGYCGTHYSRLLRTGTAETRPKALDRYDEFVPTADPDECWEWLGPLNNNGYGRLAMQYAHRIACERAHGAPPEPDSTAMHACDNPPCVNPAHLSWGTQSDNIRDMWAKGRR